MLVTGFHTIAYLAVTGLLAWVIYRKLGHNLLRKAWFNFDLVWTAALVATSLATILIRLLCPPPLMYPRSGRA